eukprot:1161634-Pelagomonas_calceolata.AAC.8
MSARPTCHQDAPQQVLAVVRQLDVARHGIVDMQDALQRSRAHTSETRTSSLCVCIMFSTRCLLDCLSDGLGGHARVQNALQRSCKHEGETRTCSVRACVPCAHEVETKNCGVRQCVARAQNLLQRSYNTQQQKARGCPTTDRQHQVSAFLSMDSMQH